MKTEKKPELMKIINGYAGSYGKLISFGRILAALSALVALIPYYDIWKIIRIAVRGEELSGASVSSKGYMLGYNDLKDPSVSGLFRLMAKLGDGAMKMKIVKIEF